MSSSSNLVKTKNTNQRQKTSYNNSQKFHCTNCHDTYINLNRSIIFRPKENNDFKFCSTCRKIPFYSEKHQSTGSTLASLSTSYQNDLELRFLDDEFDHATIDTNMGMETCIEEDLNEEKDMND